MTQRTAAAHKAAFLLAAAAARGADPVALCARYGLDASGLADPDRRIPLATVCRMWEELPGLLGDPDLPLAVLGAAEAGDPPLPVWLFLSAPTLGDALRRMARFERLGFDAADEPVGRLDVRGDRATLSVDAERSVLPPPPGAVAQTIGAMLVLARQATGAEIAPVAVDLWYPAPPSRARWVAVFGPTLRFDRPTDRLVLSRGDLDRPHPNASRTLSALAVGHAETRLAALPVGGDVLADVRRAVLAALPDGDVDLGGVADRLATSTRTLQRRLRASGTTWRDVRDAERRAVAEAFLRDPRASLAQIALTVGFADQSAFGRAFQRWTGETPAAWRLARSASAAARPAERAEPHPRHASA